MKWLKKIWVSFALLALFLPTRSKAEKDITTRVNNVRKAIQTKSFQITDSKNTYTTTAEHFRKDWVNWPNWGNWANWNNWNNWRNWNNWGNWGNF